MTRKGGLRLEAEARLDTMFGHFKMRGYSHGQDKSIALSRGNLVGSYNVLVRIQSSCLFGESFHATDCDCSWQITTALRRISEEGCGLFIYLFQEGRGIGIFEKIKAFHIQQEYNCDTVEAFQRLGIDGLDLRTYTLATEIIKCEGISSVRLLTNNTAKILSLTDQGIPAEREAIEIEEEDFKKLTAHMTEDDIRQLISYLEVKRKKLGHQMIEKFARNFLQQLNASGGN